MNEYGEWSKIKFDVSIKNGDIVYFSRDFGAIPICVSFPTTITLSFSSLERIVLRELNKYNRKTRWKKSKAGDTSILQKIVNHSENPEEAYCFKDNHLSDLEFIYDTNIKELVKLREHVKANYKANKQNKDTKRASYQDV